MNRKNSLQSSTNPKKLLHTISKTNVAKLVHPIQRIGTTYNMALMPSIQTAITYTNQVRQNHFMQKVHISSSTQVSPRLMIHSIKYQSLFMQPSQQSFRFTHKYFSTNAPNNEKNSQDEINRKRRETMFGTIPNALTSIRLFCAPVAAYLIMTNHFDIALYTFFAAGILDGIDGWIARRFDQHSVLGSYLDPLADKCLVGATMIACGIQSIISPWLIGLILARDIGLVGGALILRYKTKPDHVGFFNFSDTTTVSVKSSMISKINTAGTILLVTTSLTQAAWNILPMIVPDALSVLVATTTFWSGIDYARDYKNYIPMKRMDTEDKQQQDKPSSNDTKNKDHF